MSPDRRRAYMRRRMGRLGVALWLVLATSAALAFNPRMEHAADCPMPQHSRGQPCVLNLPAVPPPLTLGPASGLGPVVVLAISGLEEPNAPARATPQARGPPSARTGS